MDLLKAKYKKVLNEIKQLEDYMQMKEVEIEEMKKEFKPEKEKLNKALKVKSKQLINYLK